MWPRWFVHVLGMKCCYNKRHNEVIFRDIVSFDSKHLTNCNNRQPDPVNKTVIIYETNKFQQILFFKKKIVEDIFRSELFSLCGRVHVEFLIWHAFIFIEIPVNLPIPLSTLCFICSSIQSPSNVKWRYILFRILIFCEVVASLRMLYMFKLCSFGHLFLNVDYGKLL